MTDSQHEPSPSEGEGTHSRPTLFKGPTRKLVFEFLIVLLLFVVPLIVSSVSYLVSPWESSSRSLSSEVYGLIWNLGAIGLLLYFARSHGQDLRILGLRPTRWWKELIWGALTFWAAWFSYSYADLFSVVLGLPSRSKGQATVEELSVLTAILPLTLLVSAFFEEALFRAYLWNWLTHFSSRPALSLFLCASLFAMCHTDSPAVLAGHFIFGLILGVFFWSGRSLPRVVLAHWAFNLALTCMWTYWIVPADPVPLVNSRYLTMRPVDSERSEIYTEPATDHDGGELLYASDEVLLDLTHVNCGATRVERSESPSRPWAVGLFLTPEGQRTLAEWTSERLRKRVGVFVENKLLYSVTIAERISGPKIQIVALSREHAESLRDAIAAGGRPP